MTSKLKIAVLIAVSLSVVFLCGASHSIDLNAPDTKKVTIESEIIRGKSAVVECYSKSEFKISTLFTCKRDILNVNQQQNTDTDAFKLGVYFLTTIRMAGRSLSAEKSTVVAPVLISGVKECYDHFRNFQNIIGVDDVALCKLLGEDYNIVNKLLAGMVKMISCSESCKNSYYKCISPCYEKLKICKAACSDNEEEYTYLGCTNRCYAMSYGCKSRCKSQMDCTRDCSK